MSKINKIIKSILLFSFIVAQNEFNINEIKMLEYEMTTFKNYNKIVQANVDSSLTIVYNNKFFINTNQPNLENRNGLYLPKGSGYITSSLISYKNRFIKISAEPTLINNSDLIVLLPEKKEQFSVLNDVPLESSLNEKQYIRNLGVKLYFYDIFIGYGNWNQWKSPGIHNSLILSNNSRQFYYYHLGFKDYKKLINNFEVKIDYMISSAIYNNYNTPFYSSFLFLNIKKENLEIGVSQNILSGGNNNIEWNFYDSALLPINRKNMRYWDSIKSYYLLYTDPDAKIKVFFEYGYPNRTFGSNMAKYYYDHTIGTNLGFRRYGLFNKEELVFGFEYTRLVQGQYFNDIATPNWYDNSKYNFSSYAGRRWAAHSGSDSDDFLLYAGYMNKKISFIYGFNFERHGVTFSFPPEVKIESRASFKINYDKFSINMIYENEFIEHYGFTDRNRNVWNEIYETGSLQRTKTILVSIEYYLLN